MLPVINLFNSDFCNDGISNTLFFLEPEETAEARLVCTNWEKVATPVVKIQLLWRAENDLNQKLSRFFALTGKTAANLFPCLSELRRDQDKLSATELHKRLKDITKSNKHDATCSQNATCSQIEFLERDPFNNYFNKIQGLVDKNASIAELMALSNLPEEEVKKRWELVKSDLVLYNNCVRGEKAICGKTFMNFCCKDLSRPDSLWYDKWTCETHLGFPGPRFFPIDLFDLESQGENHKILGALKKTHYIPIKGKLVKFIIEDTWLPERATLLPFGWHLNLPQFYIPSLDAAAPAPETNNP